MENEIGAGVPDNSASTGTETPISVESISNSGVETTQPEVLETESQAEATTETPVPTEDTDLAADFEAAIKEQPNDTELIKRLRNLAKTKYEDYQTRVQQPTIDSRAQEQQELVQELYGFDMERGVPTTQGFAQKLAAKDIGLAQQTFMDLGTIEVADEGIQGYTLGHRYLESIGLDPFKIEELRAFSRGEINGEKFGVVESPDFIPTEYAAAYKQLPEVLRTDIDIYLTGQNPDQRAAALQLLQDKQSVISQAAATQENFRTAEMNFNNEVSTTVAAELDTAYKGLLGAVKQNPAYTGVKVSSNPHVDSTVKDSIISQINALGDPRSILAQQAVETFRTLGVQVDMPKVEKLLGDIESNTQIAVKAEKLGKLQNRDYSTHVQEALGRRSAAISQTIALANKYFSDTLAVLTKSVTGEITTETGLPNIYGGVPQNTGDAPRKNLTFAELDTAALSVARSLREAQ